MINKEIRWGCIQPLTGGMYLGTLNAAKCNAKWILSFPGLNNPGANEYNLTKYLSKKNIMPDYYTINRDMFQNDNDMNPEINGKPDFNNIDLVTAVPVCSGLSRSTIATSEHKESRNCNMLWITKYTLSVIKPKVFIFENAPTLINKPGLNVRNSLESLANENDYSIIYYKTDTNLHDNCQRRIRTFVYFFKNINGKSFFPKLEFESITPNIDEFINRISENATQKDFMKTSIWNYLPLDYMIFRFGNNWRSNISDGNIFDFIIDDNNERIKFFDWLKNYRSLDELTVFEKYFDHIDNKIAINKGWWSKTPICYKNEIPTCMHRNVFSTVHYKENRLYNMREWIHAMGLPDDFEMYGTPDKYFKQIGQNVPVRTAQFIIQQAVNVINNWDKYINNEIETNDFNTISIIYDNLTKKII